MKVNFWLLDIDRGEEDGKTVIRLWGINDKNERVVIYDKTFQPSFYLLVKNELLNSFLKELEEKKKAFKIASILIEEKKLFGRKVEALKLTFNSFEDLIKCSEQLCNRSEVIDHLEDDLRPAFKYMVEKGIVSCCWHEVEVKEVNKERLTVDKAYEAVSPPKLIEKKETPKLKILSFTITCCHEKGFLKPSENPIILISSCSNLNHKKQFSAFNLKDENIIEEFSRFINEVNPDVIVGFNNNNFDWFYLIERAEVNGLDLHVTRDKSKPHKSIYGHISIAGRANLDLLDFAKDIPEIKLETLDELADFLKIKKNEAKPLILDVSKYIKAKEGRAFLLKASLNNAELILNACEVLLDFFIQLSSITNLPLDQVIAAPVGFRVDAYLIMQAYKMNELIPRRKEQIYQSYKGGAVLSPKHGLHKNIAVLDFASMYPNLMMLYNISPDTLASPSDSNENLISIPEVEHKFRREPPGLYKIVFSNLLAERNAIKERLKQLPQESVEYKLLKERSKAVKIITNACYGYAGWIGARWYSREVAESATALGRKAIKEVMHIAEEEGLKIIYSDTDSIFVENLSEKIKNLQEKTLTKIGVEIKVDKLYKKIIFSEAKKKYAGLTQENNIDIVGMEAVRGDWANIAKTAQKKTLEILLIEENLEKALDYIKNFIKKLRKEKGDLEDFILWKTLTKPVSDYEAKAPHIEAAKKLIQKGWKLTTGDKIGYVITKGSGKLYEKAEPYQFSSIENIDVEYYIFHQVIPAVSRVVKVFGVNEKRLLDLATSSSINEFFIKT
ncbi:DNA polymerase II [Candidatus Bathyarchaeota archaeon]|nr:DNA polymerase II [Candidatus Bathyarchaeota archaeon]